MLICGLDINLIYYCFDHPARYGSAAVLNGFMYIFCIDKLTLRKYFISILYVGVGLISARAKFYGFYFIFVVFLFLIYRKIELEISVKNIFLILIVFFGMLYVTREKISYYFLDYSLDTEESYARPVLYVVSSMIFLDFFPLGSGLASFASYHSGKYYSSIYSLYDIENCWGLSEDYPSFISDTFYPTLAQIGIVGLLLFLIFFIWLIKIAIIGYKINKRISALMLLIIIFLLIESTTASTFIHNKGVYSMMILGLCYSELKSKNKEYENNNLK